MRLDAYVMPFMNWQPDPLASLDENSDNLAKAIGAKTAKINEKLREIAKLAKTDKELSAHVSRHTFAKRALMNGTNIRAIQTALGHASLNQTQRYLGDLDTHEMDNTFEGFYD